MNGTLNDAISVVYVEDDPDIRELVAIIFERETGMRLLTCEPLPEVVECIRTARPDIVLLDVMMPSLDGRTVASLMRADPELAKVPFVFMTAKARPQELAELYRLGALAVIFKPFDAFKLPDEVRALLARHHRAS
jgi:two-component system, OmpR family, response regulator